MAPPPFVVAVVGSHEIASADVRTAAWVAGRDVAWAGAWLAADVGGATAAAAIGGARDHEGIVVGFCSYEYRHVTADDVEASLVIRTGLTRPAHATVLAANVDAVLAFPGDPDAMAVIAAALQRGVPAAQVCTDLWPVRPLTPVEVPAWLDALINRPVPAVPATPDPPEPPVLTGSPQRNTPASGSVPPANTPSSSSTVSDATSSPSPTTQTNGPASTRPTPTA